MLKKEWEMAKKKILNKGLSDMTPMQIEAELIQVEQEIAEMEEKFAEKKEELKKNARFILKMVYLKQIQKFLTIPF